MFFLRSVESKKKYWQLIQSGSEKGDIAKAERKGEKGAW